MENIGGPVTNFLDSIRNPIRKIFRIGFHIGCGFVCIGIRDGFDASRGRNRARAVSEGNQGQRGRSTMIRCTRLR